MVGLDVQHVGRGSAIDDVRPLSWVGRANHDRRAGAPATLNRAGPRILAGSQGQILARLQRIDGRAQIPSGSDLGGPGGRRQKHRGRQERHEKGRYACPATRLPASALGDETCPRPSLGAIHGMKDAPRL